MAAAGPGSGSPLLSLELRLLGGALTEAPPDAGALATLDHAFLTYAVGIALDADMAAAVKRHLDVVADALEPWDAGVSYANLIEVPMDLQACFEPDALERLQTVKARYDADDLFRASHPIPVAAARG